MDQYRNQGRTQIGARGGETGAGSYPPNMRLGRYEIRSLLGAGGMGEVYRAHDPTLGRDVAIKVLRSARSADPECLLRFEQEARAAGALNHPNIHSIYDVQTHEGAPYVVSELLEGETLRVPLSAGRIPQRKALDYARQIAHALAAAHEKGIVHRDLKPENIFVTSDGRLKILDFGLAKLSERGGSGEAQADMLARTTDTVPGTVMGTVGYMSPEQLRGAPTDHRTDIFSFGVVLYEMLAGQRPFQGESTADTISAILKEDPPDLLTMNSELSPALRGVVAHCIEKNPAERFQSAHDLAFNLESVSVLSGQVPAVLPAAAVPRTRRMRAAVAIAAPLLAAALFAGGWFAGRGKPTVSPPFYRALTFRRGDVVNARFAQDGQTFVYSAAWNGSALEIFSMRAGANESRPIGLADADVLAVSSMGEMAVQLHPHYLGQRISRGRLARVPITGGTPREILEDVQEADWSPDGAQLAVVRWAEGRNRLEYPIGRVLYETSGYISHPRVSPKGDLVAFMDHQIKYDNRGWVAVVNREGEKKTLTREWNGEEGLAWSRDGNEVWFTAANADEFETLRAVTLAGRIRPIASAPGFLTIHDVARDGRALMARDSFRSEMFGLSPGSSRERDLSWFDGVALRDLSPDGKAILFTNLVMGAGTNYSTYLRKTDGSPAVNLGDGDGCALSPDGKWVLALLYTPSQLVLLPTGAGESRRLDISRIETFDRPLKWSPDGKQFLFSGREPGHTWRSYFYDLEGGTLRPLTNEGVTALMISPDGRSLLASDAKGKKYLQAMQGMGLHPVAGLNDDDDVAGWSADGRSLYVYRRGEMPFHVFRLDLSTARKEPLRVVTSTDTSGAERSYILFTPDARAYAYQVGRPLCDLYLVEGLK